MTEYGNAYAYPQNILWCFSLKYDFTDFGLLFHANYLIIILLNFISEYIGYFIFENNNLECIGNSRLFRYMN